MIPNEIPILGLYSNQYSNQASVTAFVEHPINTISRLLVVRYPELTTVHSVRTKSDVNRILSWFLRVLSSDTQFEPIALDITRESISSPTTVLNLDATRSLLSHIYQRLSMVPIEIDLKNSDTRSLEAIYTLFGQWVVAVDTLVYRALLIAREVYDRDVLARLLYRLAIVRIAGAYEPEWSLSLNESEHDTIAVDLTTRKAIYRIQDLGCIYTRIESSTLYTFTCMQSLFDQYILISAFREIVAREVENDEDRMHILSSIDKHLSNYLIGLFNDAQILISIPKRYIDQLSELLLTSESIPVSELIRIVKNIWPARKATRFHKLLQLISKEFGISPIVIPVIVIDEEEGIRYYTVDEYCERLRFKASTVLHTDRVRSQNLTSVLFLFDLDQILHNVDDRAELVKRIKAIIDKFYPSKKHSKTASDRGLCSEMMRDLLLAVFASDLPIHWKFTILVNAIVNYRCDQLMETAIQSVSKVKYNPRFGFKHQIGSKFGMFVEAISVLINTNRYIKRYETVLSQLG